MRHSQAKQISNISFIGIAVIGAFLLLSALAVDTKGNSPIVQQLTFQQKG